MERSTLLRVENLRKYFPLRRSLVESLRRKRTKQVHAVDNVSFSVKQGEIVGLVGESGSGKTTIGRLISLLDRPDAGTVYLEDVDIYSMPASQLKGFRRKVQFVFQNPYDSLDPKFTIFESLEEPLITHGIGDTREQRKVIIVELMRKIGIPTEILTMYPNKLSGGQRQRVALARAFMLNPKLLIADEPVSMLDASVRATILNMLLDLRAQKETSVVLITHDIAIARHVCDRAFVMYLGEIVEMARIDEIVRSSLHPYTRALLKAIPRPDPEAPVGVGLVGEIASAVDPRDACRLNPRCPYAIERCKIESPKLREVRPDHYVACHRSEELFMQESMDSVS